METMKTATTARTIKTEIGRNFFCLQCSRTVAERFRFSHSGCVHDMPGMKCRACGEKVATIEELETTHRLNCVVQALGPHRGRDLTAVAATPPPRAVVQCSYCSRYVELADLVRHRCDTQWRGSTTPAPTATRVITRKRPVTEVEISASASAAGISAVDRVAIKLRLSQMGLLVVPS